MDTLVEWEAAGAIIDAGGEITGSVPVGAGLAATVRIPVPGTKGLAIELTPRGWRPKGGTTSTLFIQDATGRRHLRLDYGHNVATGRVDFHWNQKGVAQQFGLGNHTPAGPGGGVLYHGARYFRHAGRLLMVVGVAADTYSVVVSDRPFRQLAIVTGGWAGAWAGCKVVGAAGAAGGTLVKPGGGTAVGGLLGCLVGGASGYWAGKVLTTEAIELGEEVVRRIVEEISAREYRDNSPLGGPRPSSGSAVPSAGRVQ